jgi:hypothetical protein
MKKVTILIPVHCAPKVVMLTLGSWLESCDGSYQAEIILAVHNNYHHYHNRLDMLQELPVRLKTVQEIQWYFPDRKESLLRYSRMHALSLQVLMEEARDIQCDYLAVLDHDLVFKTDFVHHAMETGTDLIGSYHSDRTETVSLNTEVGPLWFVPKFSVWHMVMSRKFCDKIMDNIELIFPKIENDFFFDTFSRVVAKNRVNWGLSVTEMNCETIEKMVDHLWSMSFNLGMMIYGAHPYWDRLAKYEAEYDQRFPNGIKHLFAKVGL